ncbi:MAG: hypothetical protein JWQ35_802, partial [Bacteriovoracaceae bacterium]|nr:hypothetical protein [Bacteriovoracaceae bacterium]
MEIDKMNKWVGLYVNCLGLLILSSCGDANKSLSENRSANQLIPITYCDNHFALPNSEVNNPTNKKVAPDSIAAALPVFEKTPAEIETSVKSTLATAEAMLNIIASRQVNEMTFGNEIHIRDSIFYPVNQLSNRLSLMMETSPVPEVKAKAAEQVDVVQHWFIDTQFREDLFAAAKAFQSAHPNLEKECTNLSAEDLKFNRELMRDYHRSGLDLAPTQKKQVQDFQKKLSDLGTQFDTNISNASAPVSYKVEELEGLPADFISSRKKDAAGKLIVQAESPADRGKVLTKATREETRKKIMIADFHMTDVNSPILKKMIALRDKIAKVLGYSSWADYQTEIMMAGSSKSVQDFLLDLDKRIQPKFDQDIEELRKIKASATNDPNTKLKLWDFYYTSDQLKLKKYNVDTEKLRPFLEMQRVQKGVFSIYEEIFGIRLREMKNVPYKWHPSVQLFELSDAASGQVKGYLYLDPFPRPGKFKHFAQFGIVDGIRQSDGTYQKPVAALICNFPEPMGDHPALMEHDDVVTFFHEFGHALHSILTKANYNNYAGTKVLQDFVEAPSQALENWGYDKDVLDRFAVDYRNPAIKIDRALVDQVKSAELGQAAIFWKRQIALALMDNEMHQGGEERSPAQICRDRFKKSFIAGPDEGDFAASWGHLNGYDARYYSYVWSKAIAVDMVTAFRASPKGLLDPDIGMKLRQDIYEVGGVPDPNDSVAKFLGRNWNIDAFV